MTPTQIQATKTLLEYSLCKMPQTTEISGPDGNPIETRNTLNIGFVQGRTDGGE